MCVCGSKCSWDTGCVRIWRELLRDIPGIVLKCCWEEVGVRLREIVCVVVFVGCLPSLVASERASRRRCIQWICLPGNMSVVVRVGCLNRRPDGS